MNNKVKRNVIFSAIGYVLLFILCQMVISIIFSSIAANMWKESITDKKELINKINSLSPIFTIVANVFITGLCILIAKIRKSSLILKTRTRRLSPTVVIIGILLTFFFSLSWNTLMSVLPLPQVLLGSMEEIEANALQSPILALFCVIIVAPFVEELVFRGIIFTKVRHVFNANVAILLSGFLFGLVHIVTGSLITIVFTILGGILLGIIYEKTDSFLTVVIAHIMINIAGMLASLLLMLPDPFVYSAILLLVMITVTLLIRLIKKPSAIQ